jgi:hypothetical protein
MLRRLLGKLIPWYAWRLECPHTVEAVAEHFLRHHLSSETIGLIAQLPTPGAEAYAGTELAWKRRICYIYGVATHYDIPGQERGGTGWNRSLLSDCRANDPEAAVEEIFRRVWEKARDGASDSKS